MKQVPLKNVAIKLPNGKESLWDYKRQLIAIMEAPKDPKRGVDIGEVRQSIKVIEILEKASGDFVEMEDADYEYMMSKVSDAKFTFVNSAFIQFVDDMVSAGRE